MQDFCFLFNIIVQKQEGYKPDDEEWKCQSKQDGDLHLAVETLTELSVAWVEIYIKEVGEEQGEENDWERRHETKPAFIFDCDDDSFIVI